MRARRRPQPNDWIRSDLTITDEPEPGKDPFEWED